VDPVLRRAPEKIPAPAAERATNVRALQFDPGSSPGRLTTRSAVGLELEQASEGCYAMGCTARAESSLVNQGWPRPKVSGAAELERAFATRTRAPEAATCSGVKSTNPSSAPPDPRGAGDGDESTA